MPIVRHIKGNLLDCHERILMHGVNCQGVMGAGVALAIANKWPKVLHDYKRHVDQRVREFDISFGVDKLQKIRNNHVLGSNFVVHMQGKTIINAFTQDKVGTHERQVNYGALATCFKALDEDIMTDLEMSEIHDPTEDMSWANKVAIPMIGCGLAGGDWNVVSEIIDWNTPHLEITVYSL